MNDHTNGEVIPPQREEQALIVDLERAQIDQMIATAHKYPRSLEVFDKTVFRMATYNEAAAENCVYSLPRGGKPIIGPSIGFANIVATAWGNCVDGSRWVATDRKEKVVVAEGVFHDYQTNRKVVISEQRRIVNKNGGIFTDDMIIVTSKAAGAIARRNAILQVVPRGMWFPAFEAALQLVRGTGETFVERKEKTIRAFAQFGVKPEQLWGLLDIKGDADMTLEHIPVLRGAYAALRDGSTTVEEMFDPRRMGRGGFESMGNVMVDGDDEHDAQHRAAAPARQAAPAATSAPAAQTNVSRAAASPLADDDESDFPGDIQSEPPYDHETGEVRLDIDAGQPDGAPAPAGGTKKRGRPAGSGKTKPDAEQTPAPAQTAPPAAEQQQEAPAPTPEPEQPPQPRNAEQYKAHFLGIMAAATNATALEQRWKSPQERALRGNCSVIADELEDMRDALQNRLEALRATGN